MKEQQLVFIQRLSGVAFSTFLILHFINTTASIHSPQLYGTLQKTFRVYYQNKAIEIGLLLSSLLVHLIVGYTRVANRKVAPSNTLAKLHRFTGYYLSINVPVHAYYGRYKPWYMNGIHLDFSYISYNLNVNPGPALFYPYYIAFAIVGAYHMSYGLITTYKSSIVYGKQRFRVVLGVTLTIAIPVILGLLHMGGVFYSINTERFTFWDEYQNVFYIPPALRQIYWTFNA